MWAVTLYYSLLVLEKFSKNWINSWWMNEWFHSPFKTALQISVFSPKRLHLYSLKSHTLGTPNWHMLKTDKVRESPPPPSSPTFLERTRLSSSLLPGTFSAEDNEQSQHRVTIVLFLYQHVCPRKQYITWSLGAEIWRRYLFSSHLKHQCSTDLAWRRGLELGRLSPVYSPRRRWHIQGQGDGFSQFSSLAHLYPRPSTSEIPRWNDSLLATLVPQKILGRDCAHSGSSSTTMTSLRLLVHNDEVLPEL